MAEFATSIDVCNRALMRVGGRLIDTLSDNSRNAAIVGFVYDKLRTAELRAKPWRFAIRRATLRPYTATTKRMIPPAWSASSVSYAVGGIVQDTYGIYWVCDVANTSSSTNGPGSLQLGQPSIWTQYFGPLFGDIYSSSISYFSGEIAYTAGSPDVWYFSLQNNSLGNSVSNTAYWTPLSASDLPVNFLIPAGPGVSIDNLSRNIFALPNGYLRPLPPDPKIAGGSTLATSASLRALDWEIESNFLVSASSAPIAFRFVADISDVTRFEPLFSEALAARIAWDICEMITQSPVKLQACGGAYAMLMMRAVQVSALEIGSTEPDDDDFLSMIGPSGVIDRMPQQVVQGGGGR